MKITTNTVIGIKRGACLNIVAYVHKHTCIVSEYAQILFYYAVHVLILYSNVNICMNVRMFTQRCCAAYTYVCSPYYAVQLCTCAYVPHIYVCV